MYQHRYQHIKSLILGLESGQALLKKILTIEHVSVAMHQPHPIPFRLFYRFHRLLNEVIPTASILA